MPKRKRSKEHTPVAAPGASAGSAPGSANVSRAESEQERAAKLFAESIRVHEAQDRAARERAAAEAEQSRRHETLVAEKEAAAARLRRLRAEGRPREKMAEAEAAYRASLAALTEFETGERPHWAPAPPTTTAIETDDQPS